MQAPDVCWNGPFKAAYRSEYEDWMANGKKEYTAGGNMKPPSKAQMVTWVKKAWNGLSKDMIQKSFRVCGIVKVDGSQDEEIAVMKDGGIASEARAELKEKTASLHQQMGDLRGLLHKELKEHMHEDEEEREDMEENKEPEDEEDKEEAICTDEDSGDESMRTDDSEENRDGERNVFTWFSNNV